MFRILLVAAGSLAVGACAPPGPLYEAAADPTVRVPASSYASLTAGSRAFRPVDPKGWDDLNRQVTPQSGGGKHAM